MEYPKSGGRVCSRTPRWFTGAVQIDGIRNPDEQSAIGCGKFRHTATHRWLDADGSKSGLGHRRLDLHRNDRALHPSPRRRTSSSKSPGSTSARSEASARRVPLGYPALVRRRWLVIAGGFRRRSGAAREGGNLAGRRMPSRKNVRYRR